MILTIAFLLLQAVQQQPPPPQGDDLRIIAVEQTGKPPFTPDGRIYRVAGKDFFNIKPGEILILRRPKEERSIGSLRVISIQRESLTAALETRGETFPLKGDFVSSLGSSSVPGITKTGMLSHLKDAFPFPLTPFGMPQIQTKDTHIVEETVQQPEDPRPLAVIVADFIAKMSEASSASGSAGDSLEGSHDKDQPALPQIFVEQNPIYYLPGSPDISKRGIEKLEQWVQVWSKKDIRYTRFFFAVPQSHLKLEKLLVERLTGLQKELIRLGVKEVQFRLDERNLTEPFDVIYVGIEWIDPQVLTDAS